MTDFSPTEPLVEILRMKRRIEIAMVELDEPFMPATVGELPLPLSGPAVAGAYLEDAA
jgi:hypothetical protein